MTKGLGPWWLLVAALLIAVGAGLWWVVTPYFVYSGGASDFPNCARVWQPGHKMSASAPGCTFDDGTREYYRLKFPCHDGSTMVPFAEETWTEQGRVVAGNQDEYRAALAACQGKA
jgi:hypothetical protein